MGSGDRKIAGDFWMPAWLQVEWETLSQRDEAESDMGEHLMPSLL